MSELIYVLTVIYFVFVIEEVEGDRIAAFTKDVLHIDLTQLRNAYTSLRSNVLCLIGLKNG